MPGNYSKLVTVITGQTITAAERNNEFDNVINNMTPDGVDDASANLAAMQATVDPSGGSLATNLRGELQRQRFQLLKLGSASGNWYDALPFLAGVTPATAGATATDLNNRLAQIVSQVKNMGGLTNWYDVIPTTIPSVSAARGQNILDNGGFEIWQRGISFSAPAQDTFIADRWSIKTSEAASVTVTKETTTIDSVGLASVKVVISAATASQFWYFRQMVENGSDYRGKTVTVTMRVLASVASAVRVGLADGIGSTVYSSYHTGGGAWETLTVSLAVASTSTVVQVIAGMITSGDKKNGTYYFDSVMLVIGSDAIAFAATPLQTDWARCQRFFQVVGGTLSQFLLPGHCTSTTQAYAIYRHLVKMRVAPTLTVNNPTHFSLMSATGGGNPAVTTLASNIITADETSLSINVASGIVGGNSTVLFANNADGTLYLSADL